MLDKISIDTTNTEENEIDKKLFSHLEKEDADKVKELIQKYERDKEPTEKQINDDIQKQIYSEYLGVQDNMQKEEILSFLSNSIQSKETGGDIEAILEKHLLDKISMRKIFLLFISIINQ